MALGLTVPFLFGGLVWIFRRHKAKRQERFDSRVLEALGNHAWPGGRPITGAGVVGVRATEIAEHLARSRDEVADSLERLQTQGKARKGDGTLSDSAPYWYFVQR